MSKISDYLLAALIWVFYGGLAFVYFGGMWHSVKKHSTGDVVASVLLPPWSVYRGFEMFWHDDYAGIDWEKRIRNDKEVVLGFLNPNTETGYEVSREKEAFAKEINSYPVDKITELKRTAKLYIAYAQSTYEDMDKWVLSIDTFSNTYPPYKVSATTISLGDSLDNACPKAQTKEGNSLLTQKINGDPEGIYASRAILKEYSSKTLNSYKQAYQDLFNETYQP